MQSIEFIFYGACAFAATTCKYDENPVDSKLVTTFECFYGTSSLYTTAVVNGAHTAQLESKKYRARK
jgi:ribosomal protein L33